MNDTISRRNLLKNGVAAGVGAVIVSPMLSGCALSDQKTSTAGMKLFDTPGKDMIKVGFVGIGNQGSSHIRNLSKIEGCQVTAVCDVRSGRTQWAQKTLTKAGHPEPTAYTNGPEDFKRMCEQEDLDLVYSATPWEWHMPVAMAAMKNGKQVATELNIAMSVDDYWELIEMSESSRRHCVMMENCCYDYAEMLILNMIQKGLFGELIHGECGYMHDLREYKFSPKKYYNRWRLKYSIEMNGNLYPQHGIGPMSWCMGINRGDALDYMVSFSSKSRGLNEYAKEHYPNSEWVDQKFALGDVNTCLIRTKLGKTIICKHDTDSPRPYSRDFMVQGTKGLAAKYPEERVHIEGRSPAHEWEKLQDYYAEYEHPIWTKLKDEAAGAGHGGMDYIEDYRLIQALRKGIQPDFNVYDSATWNSIVPLSLKSVATHGEPVKFPDFTRGGWKTARPLGVDTLY
jgi:predicted dehydrogenase